MNERDSFSSKLGIIAAAAGSAIGLGNIWKFPYMAGENGGGAFIVVYLLATILIGYPLIYTEFAIGRNARSNALDAFSKVTKNKKFNIVGYLAVGTVFLVATFYAMIAGWVIYYFFLSLTGGLYDVQAGMNLPDHFTMVFDTMNTHVIWPLLGAIVAIASTGFINFSGIKDGVEKYSKILMPLLFVIFIVLIGYSTTLDGFKEAVTFLFKPDFSALTTRTVISAIGQAFFSLSLGMGLLATYGSYVPKSENIRTISRQVVIADTIIALFSGLLIFPAVFTYGGSPAAGPSLIFKALPQVFSQMPGGRWFGALFFLLVIVASVTSMISIFEIIITCLVEKMNFNRHKATLVVVAAVLVGTIINILGEGPWSSFTIGGMTIFGLLDYATNNITIPLTGALTAIVATWFWKYIKMEKELTSDGVYKSTAEGPFFFGLLKWVVPPMILVLILTSL
ncbi:MAG: sodium-dependent transporter [Niameybacter sp.]|uniref:sodium-dependent transporter n=1 Tax=Niameybacter sp. TaxID=2033640 RepID=UPI002FC79430